MAAPVDIATAAAAESVGGDAVHVEGHPLDGAVDAAAEVEPGVEAATQDGADSQPPSADGARSHSLDDDVPAAAESEYQSLSNGVSSAATDRNYRSVSGYIEDLEDEAHVDAAGSPSSSAGGDSLAGASLNNIYAEGGGVPTLRSAAAHDELSVRVDRPEKVLATMDTYVTFRVLTQTNRSDFLETKYEVRRRYNDFAWLRQRVEVDHPLAMLPPLPEKHSVYSLDRFDPSFVRLRCFMLHLFLQALVRMPRINRHADLRVFLTYDLQAWLAHRKHEGAAHKVTDALYQYAASRFLTVTDSEFNAYSTSCQDFAQTIAALERMATRWHKSELVTCQELASIHGAWGHWAEAEEQPRLRETVNCVSVAMAVNNAALDELCARWDVDMILPWKHWAQFAESVRMVLRRRDAVQWEQCSARDALSRKTAEQEAASGRPTEARVEQRQQRIAVQLDELRGRAGRADSELCAANATVRAELIRWQAARADRMNDSLRALIEQRIEYHRRCCDAWERALATSAPDDNDM